MKIGINLLVTERNGSTTIVNRDRTKRTKLMWVSNLRSDKVGMTNNFYLNHDFHNHLLELSNSGKIDLIKIKQFRANDRREDGRNVAGIVDPYELYSIERSVPVYSVFYKDKVGNRVLLTTGSKCIEEFRAVGHDMYQHSEVPLLVSVRNKQFQSVNL